MFHDFFIFFPRRCAELFIILCFLSVLFLVNGPQCELVEIMFFSFVSSLSRSTRWTSRELSGSHCITPCSITSITRTSCVRTR